MTEETLQNFAPYIVIVIYAISSIKIFARSDELKDLKANIFQYMIEKFVSKDTYTDNHKALQDQMLQIHNDVSEVKNLLIGIIKNRGN